MANKIKDFGEKIGGAKKDLYAALADGSLDDVEKQKYVRKDKIWPPYKAEKLVSSGIPRDVAFWRNEIRKTVPSKPAPGVPAEWYVETVTKVRDLVDSVDTPEKAGDFRKSLSAFIVLDEDRKHYWTLPEASGTVTQKLVNAAYTGFHVYRAKAEQELYGVPAKEKEILLLERQFGVFRVGKEIYAEKDNYGRTVAVVPTGSGKEYYYPDRSQMEYDPSTWVKGRYAVINRHYRKIISNSFLTSGDASECMENLVKAAAAMNRENRKKRKGAFPVPELRAVRREGPDYRHSRHASGKYFMEHFGIRGGEFGNWMDDATAQESMDKCYDAFHDLARILGIHPHDISLPAEGNRALAIAFGSRGRGRAMAHYEPAGKVINLTKYRGMGCLAHEWGHALDDYTGFRCGVRTGKTGSMASEACLTAERAKLPRWFLDLSDAIRCRADGTGRASAFLEGSRKFDSGYSNAGHGYWSSPREMFARAFDCYAASLLRQEGSRSGYLTSHAFSYFYTDDGERVSAVPEGEERERIFMAFDVMFKEMKSAGWLSGYPDTLDGCIPGTPGTPATGNGSIMYQLEAGEDGQLKFMV